MTKEIQPYTPAASADLATHTDSWVDVLAPVGDLSSKIASTDFVPKDFRGKPAAVAAAILFGREVGLPPMTTLKNTYVVHGTPDLSAEAQRALVLAAGHEIDYIEATATRCQMRFRRKGSEDWTKPVSYTLDEAKQSGDFAKNPNYKSRPTEMLIARCSSRGLSMHFPDVIGGYSSAVNVPLPAGATDTDDQGENEPATVTVTREELKPKPKPKPRKVASKPAAATPVPEPEPPALAGPPLPGEDGFEDMVTVDEPPADEPAEVVEEPQRTEAQSKKLFACLRSLGIASRDEGLEMIGSILGREVESTKTLTKSEAAKVIDALESMEELDRGTRGIAEGDQQAAEQVNDEAIARLEQGKAAGA